MNGRKLRPLLLPVGVTFFQNMLLIFGEPGKVTPADMLINAFVSRQTAEFREFAGYPQFAATEEIAQALNEQNQAILAAFGLGKE